MRQDRVPVVEVSFFLIDIALEDLVNLSKHLFILEAHIELCQVVADLDAIPRLRLMDLIDNLVTLFYNILHLCLGSLLACAATDIYWGDTQLAYVGIVIAGH